MLRLLLVFLIIRNCVSDEDYPKCCDSDRVLQKINSTYNCIKNESHRIAVIATSTNFREEELNWGSCVDIEEDRVGLFNVNGTEVTKERELDVTFYPKCCPVQYFYNSTTHGCVKSETKLKTFFKEKFVKVGLPQCKIIVDIKLNINKYLEERNGSFYSFKGSNNVYSEGLFCTDRDENGQIIARICHDDFSICESMKCVHKCCPDGQSFINGSKCFDTYVNGLDLSALSTHMDNVNDSFAVIHGFSSKLYPLFVNRFNFYLYRNGTFMQTEVEEVLEKRNITRYYTVEEESYCIEHAVKNTMNGVYFFRGFPKEKIEIKFQYTRVAMAISCVFLFLTVLYYSFSNEKRTLFGKTLISYCLASFMAFFLLSYMAFKPYVLGKRDCIIITFLILYSTLAVFTWMNVMCVDIYWTFGSSKSFSSRQHGKKELKRFLLYSLYGWGLPLTLTALPLTFYHVNVLPPSLQVTINLGKCGIYKENGNYAQLLFWTTPHAIMAICNLMLFIRTAVYCIKVKREISKMNDTHATKGERKQKFNNFRDRFGLLIKLFLIMGISFLFEVVSTFYSFNTNRVTNIIQIIWDTFNCLQGLFIFIIFIVKKRILKKFEKKVGLTRLRKFSLGSSAMTQTTSIPTLNNIKL